jgi:hypothetical protein
VTGFLYLVKKIVDQNGAFNQSIVKQMEEIVIGLKEYNSNTCDRIEKYNEDMYDVIAKHDDQAKVILSIGQETLTILKNRPCVASRNDIK